MVVTRAVLKYKLTPKQKTKKTKIFTYCAFNRKKTGDKIIDTRPQAQITISPSISPIINYWSFSEYIYLVIDTIQILVMHAPV